MYVGLGNAESEGPYLGPHTRGICMQMCDLGVHGTQGDVPARLGGSVHHMATNRLDLGQRTEELAVRLPRCQ